MKTLVLDLIEVTKDGGIQVRMHKLSSDGDMIGYHRTAVAPGGDVAAQMAAVNAHMETEDFAPVSQQEIARIQVIAQAAWKKE